MPGGRILHRLKASNIYEYYSRALNLLFGGQYDLEGEFVCSFGKVSAKRSPTWAAYRVATPKNGSQQHRGRFYHQFQRIFCIAYRKIDNMTDVRRRLVWKDKCKNARHFPSSAFDYLISILNTSRRHFERKGDRPNMIFLRESWGLGLPDWDWADAKMGNAE